MFLKHKHTTITLSIAIFTLIIIDIFVVLRFFTYDKLNEITYSKASVTNSENIISDQIEKFKEPKTFAIETNSETYTDMNKDELKNTNELKINKTNNNSQEVQEFNVKSSSRSSAKRNTIENINNEVENTNNSTKSIKTNTETSSVQTSSNYANNSIPASQTSIGTIEIPKTNVNLPILDKVSVAGMEVATCFLYSTGSINNNGTTIIVGHNYQNGKLFSNNNNLQIGDVIYITTSDSNKRCYTIYDKFVTTPDDLSYIDRNTTNQAEIALSCCTNDEQGRIVILAK